MEKELQNILNELKDSIKCPSIKEIDYLTEECYEMPNFFVLDPTTNECELLNNYIIDLQTQLKKQKEIIDKIRKEINEQHTIMGCEVVENWVLLQILENKEV